MSTSAAFDAESRVPQILVGSIVPLALTSILVVARLYSRFLITGSGGWDDLLVCISWVQVIALTTMDCLFTRYGGGRHHSVQYALLSAKLAFGSRILYQLVLGTTKIAILILYLRIFRDRTSKLLIILMTVFVVLFTLGLVFFDIFQCKPVQAFWDTQLYHNCTSTNAINSLSAGFNISSDFLLLAFIIPRITTLNIGQKQKIALVAIVSTSSLAIIAAIIRLVRIIKVTGSLDKSWDSYDITTWSAVEVNTGLFCACAPVLRPFIRLVFYRFLSETSQGYRRSTMLNPSGLHPSRHQQPNGSVELSTQNEFDSGFGCHNSMITVSASVRGGNPHGGIPEGGELKAKTNARTNPFDDHGAAQAVLNTYAPPADGGIVKTVMFTVNTG